MKTRVIIGIAMLLVCTTQAAADTAYDAFLQRIVHVFDLRPLPTKPFEETAKYRLGRALFFDPILSGNRDVSCATCHLFGKATTDALSFSVGTGAVGLAEDRALAAGRLQQPRNALDLWNRDNNAVRAMFWDGRVEALDPVLRTFRSPLGHRLPAGLENTMAVQALFPLAQEDEMLGVVGDRSPPHLGNGHANHLNELASKTAHLSGADRTEAVLSLVMSRLLGGNGSLFEPWQGEYRKLFQAAYPEVRFEELSIVQAANALAHFEEIAFATRQTRWDQYLAGDRTAIGERAKRGAFLFFGKARCVACHNGPLLSDFKFHSVGARNLGPGYDGAGEDLGRYTVTGEEADKYKFRTPPLRNVTLTAPYFHNGSAATLREALEQHLDPLYYADKYDEAGHLMMTLDQINAVSPILTTKMWLDEEDIESLIEFLHALEDPGLANIDRIVPASVPSGLPVSAVPVNAP